MRKITLLFFALVAFCWQSNAQSTINITTSGGSYSTEKWVSITTEVDGGGTLIWGQGDGTQCNGNGWINTDILIDPGTYYVNCYDTYDDGWDGTLITVTAYGNVLGDNGGVSPNDGEDTDVDYTCEGTPEELEASFVIVVPNPPACSSPTGVVITPSITTASISWTAPVSGTPVGYNWEIQPDGVAQGTAGAITGSTANTMDSASGLTGSTTYDLYIQTDCDTDGTSNWVGPFTFLTECAALIAPTVTETFSSYTGAAPASLPCWSEAGTGALDGPVTGTTSTWSNQNYNNVAGPNGTAVYINLYDADDEWIISPTIDLGDGSTPYQLVYNALVIPWTGTDPVTDMGEKFVKVVVSTDNGTTWSTSNVLETYDTSNIPGSGGVLAALPLAGYTGEVKFAFFAYSTTTTQDLRFYIDNFRVEEVPTVAPVCATNLVSTPSVSCGNGATALSWDAVTGAEGYYLTVGTTSGGNEIIDNQSVASTSFSVANQTVNTVYYWTIVPYNSVGSASGCSEESYTTASSLCYCTAAATSTSFEKIGNVTFSDINNSSTATAGYEDFTAIVGNVNVNSTYTFTASFSGSSYDDDQVLVWIDFNQDGDFEDAGEQVLDTGTGMSPWTGDITIPASAMAGQTRMRVRLHDSVLTPNATPCGTSSYGQVEDYTLNIGLLSTDEFSNKSLFTYYPNPVSNTLNLNAQHNIQSVSVMNMLGQEVLRVTPNTVNSVLDLSNLTSGSYFVNVMVEGVSETVRIIKN